MFPKRSLYSLVVIVLLMLGQTAVFATPFPPLPLPTPQLLADINTYPSGSRPQYFSYVNNTIFFSADDGLHGFDLWKTDGTESGTVLLNDPDDPNTPTIPSVSAFYNGAFYYAKANGLWKSDGTQGGTTLVSDQPPNDLSNPTIWNGILYFTAHSGGYTELWRTDGTEVGTYQLSTTLSLTTPVAATTNGLFFISYHPDYGEELWVSDGTSGGTTIVKDIAVGPEHSRINSFVSIDTTLFFIVEGANYSSELWTSDGTEGGTNKVTGSPNWPGPANLRNLNGDLIFTVGDTLWKSDGTTLGTVEITPAATMSDLQALTVWGNHIYFIATGSAGDRDVLWRTDGTAVGTVIIEDSTKLRDVEKLAHSDNTLFFWASDIATAEMKLWATDGSSDNAHILTNEIELTDLDHAIGVGNTLYFQATGPTHGSELWKSDGTENGTVLVKNIHLRTGNTNFNDHASLNDILYFSVTSDDFSVQNQMWRSDGTSVGTSVVQTDPPFWGPRNLITIDNTLYFTAAEKQQAGGTQLALFASDGTVQGTAVVKYFETYASPANFTDVDGTLFFTLDTNAQGEELWKSDGTESGTTLVKDIWSGYSDSRPQFLTSVNGILYFQADDGNTGQELWRSDGTAIGTYRVKDIVDGADSSSPQNLVNLNGTLLFTANAVDNHVELWQSDGTENGTTLIQTVPAQTISGHYLKGFTVAGDKLFFFNGFTLWVSDGTAVNTFVLGVFDSPYGVATIGDKIYFFSDDGSCLSLWESDGTLAGTIKKFQSQSCSVLTINFTQMLATVNNHILYWGFPDKNLWYSDGTAAGTKMFDANSYNGTVDRFYQVVGNTLFFVGDTYESGSELFALELPTVTDVGISSQNNNGTMQFSWANDPTLDYYEVWRSEKPYFSLDDADAVKRATINPTLRSNTLTYQDDAAPASAIGDPNVNHFYWVVGIDENGETTAVSNQAAEFDFAIESGD